MCWVKVEADQIEEGVKKGVKFGLDLGWILDSLSKLKV